MYLICSFSGVTSQILHWTLKTPQYLKVENSYTDQCVCLRKKIMMLQFEEEQFKHFAWW